VAVNPIQGLRKPRASSRGVQTLISPADHTKLLEAAPDCLKNVLTVLFQTGARPGEVLSVTAADFHPDRAVWILQRHKAEHETGKPRVIFLTAEVVRLCRELAAKHPTGPLFRTARGKTFPPAYYLARLVRGLCRKLGIRGVLPYGYRHTFATDALARGIADAQVAELLGHSGTGMLHRHYSHLTARQAALREALGRVRDADPPKEPPPNETGGPPGQAEPEEK
jgi:integrase